MNDALFLQLFEDAALPFSEWTHRAHLKVAYLYLRAHSFVGAAERMRRGIRRYNEAHAIPEGATSGFHQTVTLAWLHLIAATLAQYGPLPSSDDFFDAHPELTGSKLLRLFYSRERLLSPESKAHFVEPDLAPLTRWAAASTKPQRMRLDGESGLRLRPVRLDDATEIHDAVRESFIELSPWMDWCREGYSIPAAVQWCSAQALAWDREEEYAFIIEGTDEHVAGVCGLNEINFPNSHANLGYWIRTSYARRGLASRAARRVAQFAFEVLGLQRVEIVAAVENEASQRTAQRAGAVREGVLRKRFQVGERAHDAVMFSFTRDNFPELNRERE